MLVLVRVGHLEMLLDQVEALEDQRGALMGELQAAQARLAFHSVPRRGPARLH